MFRPDWDPYYMGAQISAWEPIERLDYLQLLFAKQPYFGRELRYFNEHPWWYRVEFTVPEGAPEFATLRFEGVDYFAKVWLNGELLGEHEGYAEPFSFEVTEHAASRRAERIGGAAYRRRGMSTSASKRRTARSTCTAIETC